MDSFYHNEGQEAAWEKYAAPVRNVFRPVMDRISTLYANALGRRGVIQNRNLKELQNRRFAEMNRAYNYPGDAARSRVGEAHEAVRSYVGDINKQIDRTQKGVGLAALGTGVGVPLYMSANQEPEAQMYFDPSAGRYVTY